MATGAVCVRYKFVLVQKHNQMYRMLAGVGLIHICAVLVIFRYLKSIISFFVCFWQASQNTETSSGTYQNIYFYDVQELSHNSSPLH